MDIQYSFEVVRLEQTRVRPDELLRYGSPQIVRYCFLSPSLRFDQAYVAQEELFTLTVQICSVRVYITAHSNESPEVSKKQNADQNFHRWRYDRQNIFR